MLQFFKLSKLDDEIAMDVQGFEMRKLLEMVVKRCEIIMWNVDPLKIAGVVHYGLKDSVQPCKISDLIVA